MSKLSFSGHETFQCRHFWPKKGYDFLVKNKSFTDDDAVVELGVGKNMVSSIKYWLQALDIADENYELKKIANYLFGEDGKDPYLEDIGTLYLLHYLLVTKGRAPIYNFVFNEFRKEKVEFTKEHLLNFLKRKAAEKDVDFNPKTVKKDIGVFIKNYMRPSGKINRVEDDFSGLFIDLGLLREVDKPDEKKQKWYKIESGLRPDLPPEILLHTIVRDEKYDRSIDFYDLLNSYNSPGTVFALTADGLMSKISRLVEKYSFVTYTEDAGIKQLQIDQRIGPTKMLNEYYGY